LLSIKILLTGGSPFKDLTAFISSSETRLSNKNDKKIYIKTQLDKSMTDKDINNIHKILTTGAKFVYLMLLDVSYRQEFLCNTIVSAVMAQ